MRLLRNIVLGLIGLAIVLAAAAYLLPRQVSVARSILIAAPPAKVFPYVNSLQKFTEWSPWAAKDPAMKVTFEGPAEGVGAKMSWASDVRDVGTGTQEITESTQDERVVSSLAFGGMAPAGAYFDLEAEGEGTLVTWTVEMDMGMNLVGRWFGLMMDGMVGKDFDRGLANLKTLAEKG